MPAVRIVTTLLGVFVGCITISPANSQEPALVVQVASGRQFSGAIDGASSQQQLVLRTGLDGLTLRRSILWERIVAATLDGQPVGVAKLQALAGEAAATAANKVRESGIGNRGSGIKTIVLRGPANAQQPPAAPPAAPVGPPPQVIGMAFDAALANWDADVETDGLELDVAPLDGYGYLIPADATVQVELFAPQRRILADAPQSGGDTLELVERWNRSIMPEDYSPSGARLRLPFGAIHPEIDIDWAASWYGLVHVRLVVPGHGVFDGSRDGVRIRPWAPNRDNLEMNTGRRFLPTERLGRRD